MLSVCFQLDTYIAEVLAGVTLNVNTFEFWHGRGPSGIVRRVGSITFKMYFNYKIQITFLKSNSNTFFNYFGYDGQNTKYIS